MAYRAATISASVAKKLSGLYSRIKEIIEGTSNVIGEAIAPTMIRILQIQKTMFLTVQQFVKQYSSLVPVIFSVGSALVIGGTILAGIGAAVFGIGTALGAVASAVVSVATFLATPFGITLAILADRPRRPLNVGPFYCLFPVTHDFSECFG